MSSLGHLPELESLRSQVADLARELAERDRAMLTRQQADAAQRETERRLRFTQFALDHAGDAVLWADESRRFTYANDTACRLLGYSREELLGLTIADVSPRHDPKRFQDRIDNIKQGDATLYESTHRRKDGSEFPVEVSVTFLEHEGKGYTCGIIRDITERQRVEQERLQALTDLRNITETVPDFMFTLDTQGNMVKWNRRVEEVTGYSPEEIQRKSALAFVPAQEQENTALAIQRAFTDGKAELEGHLLTKDQRTIPYHWTGAVLKDPQGQIIGITGIGRDVSEQKQAAEFLQRQRQHLLEAQALAHLGSWEWDIESGETDWSEEQFRIFGHEPGAIAVTYDTFLAALLPDDHDRVLAAVNDALLGKCPLDLECRIVRPDGDIRVIHMRADVQRDATAHAIGMAGTALDITERKQAEEALRASEERWHLAVQGSNDGIWDWNIQSREIFFSARWKAMRGFADHEVTNHIDQWRSRIHPDDLDHVLLSIDHYLAKQTSAFCEEYRVQHKDGSYMWILDRGVALWAEDGTPVRMAGSETDITDRKRTETSLRHRLEFERLVASLSTHFINLSSENIDSGITHALRSLAEFSDVDRSYVFMFRDHGRTVDNTHEWCAGGITPQIDRLQALPVDAFSWIMARHQRGEVTHLSRVKDLPPEANAEREEFEREEIRSLLTLPIIGAQGVIGFLGFDMVREERHWEPEDIALLKFVSEMFANAIERKQAEAALRKSVDRFDLGVQGSRDGLWYAERVSDNLFAPHNPIYYSPRMKEIMGVEDGTMPDVLGTWLSLVHPDDLPTVLSALTQHLEQRLPYDTEYRILQPGTGTLRWIGAKGQAVWDSSEQPIRMAGSFSDITERKRAEGALRASQEKLQQALRASHTGLWDWNTDTNETALSAEWKHQLGYEGPELADTFESWETRLHPEDHDRVIAYVQAYLANPEGDYQQEFRLRHKDGTYRWIEARAAFVTEPDGRRVRLLGSHIDITERKRDELAFRESEARTRSILETALDAIVSINESGLIIGWNPQAEVLFGYAPHEVLGCPLDETIIPARYRQAHAHGMNRMLQSDDGTAIKRRFEFFALHRSGQEFPVEFAIASSEVGGQPMFTAFIRDISERKRAEEALRESEERYRTLVELSPSGVFVFSEGRTVYVNSMAMTLLGATEPNDILARSPFEFIHPDYHEDVTQNLRRVLAGEATVHRAERLYLKMDGTPIHVQVEAVRITWNGTPAIQGFFSDITERKRAEEATTRSYDLLKSFVEHTPAAVAMLDNDLRYVAVSRRWLQDYRLGDQELVGKRHYDIFPEISAMNEWQAIHQRCLAGAVEQREEDRFVRTDGSEDWLRWEVRPWQDVTGHTGGIIMFTEVITERKRAEEALRASEERLRLSLEAANQGIYDINVQTGETHVSPGYATMLGYDPSSFRETNADWIARLHPHDRTRVQTYYRDYIEGKTAEYRAEFRQRAQNGEWRWILSLGRIVERSAKGEPLRMLGTHTDITERKQAEEALRDTNYMLQALIETSPLAIIGLDQEGTNVTRWNPAAEKIFGWRAAEVLGHPLPYIPAEDQTHSFAIWEETTQTGVLTGKELQRLRKDGSSINVAFWSTALKDTQGTVTGTFAFIADITDRKRTEEALMRSEQQLRTVLDTLPIGVWFTDEKGHVLYGNPVGHRIWAEAARVGLPRPGDDGLWWETIAQPDAPHRWAVGTVLARGQDVQNETFSIETRAGECRTIRNSAVPVKSGTGEMLGAIVLNEDITDRVRAEKALFQEHALLMAVMDAATDIIFVKDLEGRYIHINRAGARALRMPVEEVIGWNDYAIWPSDLAASCQLADRRVLETGEPVTVEETSVCDGITTIYLTTKAPYRNSEGQIIGVIGVARDITERKQAEEALREQHALLSAIMNTTMDIIFVKDLEGHYLHMNPAGARVVGLSPQEVVGKDDDAIWPADLAACCKEADRLILSTGSAQTLEESTIANGKRITYLTTKAPYRDAAGNMIGIIGVAHDISQIKQSEEDLRRSHAFIRQIIDTNPNFIFAKNREGRFTLVNKAVAEAYGTTVERLVGKTDADFNSNTRELAFFRKTDLEVMDSLHEQFIAEEMITDSAGHTRWLQTVKRPILDESGKAAMVLGASTDITERKRIEETLRQRERDLRTALDERERISQDLHDGILQSLYAVGLGLEACKPLMTQRHYKKAAASMDRAIGQLNHVMSEVRNFIAGLESQILQGSTFPMALRTMVLTLTADHPIPCTLTIDESLADTFSTEQALHLLNVVREALSNSFRHAEATKTTVSLKSLSRSIRLTITDNGRGFDHASMRGTGHGLTNMEARARKIGGRFAIRSAPQHGTRITIDLPKETRHAESESEHGSTAARR